MTSPRLKAALAEWSRWAMARKVFGFKAEAPQAATAELLSAWLAEPEEPECYCEGNTFCPQHMPRDATGFPLGPAAPEPNGRLKEIEDRLDGLDEDVAMLINQRKPTPESELTKMAQEDGDWDTTDSQKLTDPESGGDDKGLGFNRPSYKEEQLRDAVVEAARELRKDAQSHERLYTLVKAVEALERAEE